MMENNIKRLLLKRVFAGHFIERRLVDEATTSYKDVIRLYPDEIELARDLSHACEVSQMNNQSLFGSYTRNPPAIWAEPTDTPFGKHWFQINGVEFGAGGICYYVKSLRYFPGVEYPTSTSHSTNDSPPITADDLKDLFQNIYVTLKTNMNLRGLVNIFKFISILVTTLFIGLFKLVFFTGDFSIKVMKELNIFIEASTPMFLGMLEFFSKVIGGFYILMAMIFRNFVNRPQPPPNQPMHRDYSRPMRAAITH